MRAFFFIALLSATAHAELNAKKTAGMVLMGLGSAALASSVIWYGVRTNDLKNQPQLGPLNLCGGENHFAAQQCPPMDRPMDTQILASIVTLSFGLATITAGLGTYIDGIRQPAASYAMSWRADAR